MSCGSQRLGRALRRDECGSWRINGTSGHIYADGNGWRLYVACRSARAWTAAKGRLGFCRVTQDGDDEGVLCLDSLPSPEQAAIIRRTLGIRKRKAVSEATVERLRQTGFQHTVNRGFSGQDARDEAAPSHPAQMAAEIVHSERTGCGAGRLARSCHPTNGRATRPIAKPSTSSADRAGEDGGPVRGGYR